MNVDSAISMSATKTTDSTGCSASSSASKDSSANFKEELENANKTSDTTSTSSSKDAKDVKTEDTKKAEAKKNADETAKTEAKENSEAQATKNTQQNNSQQVTKDEKSKDEKQASAQEAKNSDVLNSLKELNSQIESMNNVKVGSVDEKLDGVSSKSDKDKNVAFCSVMKMDSQDASFFLNLVQNNDMSAQTTLNVNQGNNLTVNFTDVKAEATQKTSQVSQTLLDSLSESMQTNKPFRIDFDNNISVVMKVDKDGVLSANFIPGSTAVENYLRNNIAGLRQNFEAQNLPYNDLSYSERHKDNQQERQQRQQDKEKENE